MKGLLRRLHLASSSEDPPDCADPKAPKIRYTLSDSSSSAGADSSRAFSGVLGLLRVAKDTLNQAGSLKRRKEGLAIEQERKGEKEDPPTNQRNELNLIIPARRQTGTAETRREAGEHADNAASPASSPASRPEMQHTSLACTSSDSTLLAVDAFLKGTPGIYRTQTAETAALQFASDQAVLLQDEELQVRVAMALSVRDDPEAATIETVKDATRGADSLLLSSSGQLLAYRYWKYSALSYNDKIVDGFYDVYSGVPNVSIKQMPSLTTLKEASISKVMWDAVVVNRAADPELVRLEQKAIVLASEDGSNDASDSKMEVVKRIAKMVADQMGGSVMNADSLLEKWKASSAALRLSAGSVVLPLGQLRVGLGHHRALLFKVLADAVGIPCQLIKGNKYALDEETALTVIKDDSEKEYIIDLMAAPGSLYPYDASLSMAGKCLAPLQHNLDMGAKALSIEDGGKKDVTLSQGTTQLVEDVRAVSAQPASKPAMLRRSPSWTEGVGRQSAKESKVKDVSEYMINAAKDNPFLAQKLHDVLIESGVKAPPDLFSEKSQKQLQDQMIEELKIGDDLQKIKASKGDAVRQKQKSSVGPGRPVFVATYQPSSLDEGSKEKLQRLTSVEGLGARHPLDILFLNVSPGSSPNSSASSGAAGMQSTSPVLSTEASSNAHETFPSDLIKGPVAAAAATAAVVASSMLVAATKSEGISDTALDVPVAMAATATAAVVAATTAVVGRRIELPFLDPTKGESFKKGVDDSVEIKYEEAKYVQQHSDHSDGEDISSGHAEKHIEDEKVSDKSTSSVSVKSDGRVFDDVAECEIPWEDLVIGERIGIGSYGEVYRGDWHGTEVAVKKFLDQDISGDALLEFASEVRLMKRMRHPNVVLFMGAVMQQPNLSIVTEFLPRGSLYRLIHRSNNQLDERRRVRMALDVARGMNYLHNCVPVIVHRDLKSPNLLVDKNWVVKVCDFGLSRLKNGTYLSSKSTAGTPEWMAPEVLRNEPSNEKSDVYSFGVILWELATLQQPWAGMNPMQVVGAVGFQHRTLDIPSNLDPIIVSIIRECWHSNPTLRPSFAQIMNALKNLQKPIIPAASPKV